MPQKVSDFIAQMDSLDADLDALDQQTKNLIKKIQSNGHTGIRKKLWTMLTSKIGLKMSRKK